MCYFGVDLNEARKGSNFFIEQAGGGGQARPAQLQQHSTKILV